MNMTISLVFAALIAAGLAADALANDWTASLFLARKLIDLLSWIAFWR
jgi:hypothetical protein